jgi:transcriptional regulator with XRE-family HTH domain
MKQSEWKNVFSNNLSDILEEKGMSQAQLARDSGVSMGMISDYINKRSVPGIFAVINMAYALDMEVSELIDFGDRVK